MVLKPLNDFGDFYFFMEGKGQPTILDFGYVIFALVAK